MPSKRTSDSFIHELRLKASPEQINILNKRLDVGRQIYNACLGEALKRLALMRESTLYQQAKRCPLENKQTRNQLFKTVREHNRFREYDLHSYVKTLNKDTWLSEHIDSSTAQKLATRAFNAVNEHALGKRGRPRFKSYGRFGSVEGKSNATGIRWVEGKIKWGKGFKCDVQYDLKDPHGLEVYALCCKTKYVRLVRRKVKGNVVWYAQLVQEGLPYIKEKNKLGQGVVGLDIGPSTIAIVGDKEAHLQAFCPEVDNVSDEIKCLQRKMSRSLRMNNPDNFEFDTINVNANGHRIKKFGKVKKGVKTWIRTKHYVALSSKVFELQRTMAATRKTSHGRLSNLILEMGKEIKTEKLSYKGFQKNFGKSVGYRAPGLLMEMLRRKAENAGGSVIEFNTRTTALSQSCQCGSKRKKALSERWHECPHCDIHAQRDLYSAYLARFVEENKLDRCQAINAWPGAGILLEQALSSLKETTTSKTRLASFGLGQRQSCLSVKEGSTTNEALDVVATT